MLTRTRSFGFPNVHFVYFIFSVVCFYCFIFSATAQVEPDFLAFTEEETAEVKETPTNTAAYYFRHFKKLSPSYEGYLIELIVANEPLRRDFPLFQYFGNVHYRRLKGGKVAYYILGKDFNSRSSVKKFIKNIVIHQAPEARLVVKK